jgi:hypothetical protein
LKVIVFFCVAGYCNGWYLKSICRRNSRGSSRLHGVLWRKWAIKTKAFTRGFTKVTKPGVIYAQN